MDRGIRGWEERTRKQQYSANSNCIHSRILSDKKKKPIGIPAKLSAYIGSASKNIPLLEKRKLVFDNQIRLDQEAKICLQIIRSQEKKI